MTPACRALDAAGIEYTLHPYEHDPSSTSYGDEAVAAIGVEPDRVFKTLMALLDTNELVVAIVPVSSMLDLKALASALGTKRATMAPVALAERSSGYVAGGISPFGQRTPRRTAIDEIALACDTVFVSGGRRGLDLELPPSQLISLLHATVATLV
jgi:Cys-tRNA(Pro)/Cys-tRNA(Cys) deacylase